jgi:hypothetical protein
MSPSSGYEYSLTRRNSRNACSEATSSSRHFAFLTVPSHSLVRWMFDGTARCPHVSVCLARPEGLESPTFRSVDLQAVSVGVHGGPCGLELRASPSTGVHHRPLRSTENDSQLGTHRRRMAQVQILCFCGLGSLLCSSLRPGLVRCVNSLEGLFNSSVGLVPALRPDRKAVPMVHPEPRSQHTQPNTDGGVEEEDRSHSALPADCCHGITVPSNLGASLVGFSP